MFDLIASGKVSPDRLVGDTVTLEDVSDVLASMASYDTLAMPVITRF
jgi:threonine dehydrogenase-like Zn-dependent dehydrogenase